MEELGGGTLPLDPWAHQGMEILDRPTILPITQGHVPPDGFQAASLKRRWRKALIGTVGPVGPSSSAGGQDLCPHFAVGGQAPGVALVGGWVTSLRGGPAGGHHRPTSGRPTLLLLGHFAQRGSEHSGPRLPVSPGPGARGPAGGHRPAPDLAGHLATQEGAERGGTGVPGTHFWHGYGGGPLQ